MTFLFRFRRAMPGGVVEMGAVATGLARLAGGATIFGGQLITFALDNDVPAAGTATLLTLQPDTGDTGTGNGNQT